MVVAFLTMLAERLDPTFSAGEDLSHGFPNSIYVHHGMPQSTPQPDNASLVDFCHHASGRGLRGKPTFPSYTPTRQLDLFENLGSWYFSQ